VERGATIADLASEFLARESGSAGAGSSVVVLCGFVAGKTEESSREVVLKVSFPLSNFVPELDVAAVCFACVLLAGRPQF